MKEDLWSERFTQGGRMFTRYQQEYEFNWEDMHNKVLTICVGKDSYDGKEETTMVMGWERGTDTYYVLHKSTKRITNES